MTSVSVTMRRAVPRRDAVCFEVIRFVLGKEKEKSPSKNNANIRRHRFLWEVERSDCGISTEFPTLLPSNNELHSG